ncbi:MAG: hypothetical protein ABFR62_12460 [Bacteroidota bacterium]
MKHKIIIEIREIAREIESSNSLNATVLKEKISSLRDKLVILEFLEGSIGELAKKEETAVDDKQETLPEITEEVVADKKEAVKEDIIEVVADEITKVDSKAVESQKEEDIPQSLHESMALQKSLHDELKKTSVQIGLNDRIAFVKELFDGNQQDFNRVLSQVNSFNNYSEVEEFIDNYVKPEHDWDNQEKYVDRFMEIIGSKFEA